MPFSLYGERNSQPRAALAVGGRKFQCSAYLFCERLNKLHSESLLLRRVETRGQPRSVVRDRKQHGGSGGVDANNDVTGRIFHRIGDRFSNQKAEGDS